MTLRALLMAVFAAWPGLARAQCGPAGDTCCIAHATAGCGESGCCELVCANDPACCEAAWDQACTESAARLCPSCASCALIELLPDDGAAGDGFGTAVALDGMVALIGAPDDDDNGADAGSAYVFRFDGSSWVQEAKLLATDGAAGDRFGASVAVSGDVAVIGAPGDDEKGNYSGSAYFFRFDGMGWAQEAKILASDGGPPYTYAFGYSVAASGEVALVGAPYSSGYDGLVCVFRFDGTGWQQEDLFTTTEYKTAFGWQVAASGDVAVIAAIGFNGQTAVYRFDGARWAQEACPGEAWAVAADGDVAVTGIAYDADIGSAYFYRFDGSGWVPQGEVHAVDAAAGDSFAYALGVSGDLTVSGAPYDDDEGGGADSGSAYVHRFDGSAWVPGPKLHAPDGAAGDEFGSSIAVSGQIAVIGAPHADVSGTDSGSAHVFGLGSAACGTCPWDCGDGDGSVGIVDLLALLGQWGATGACDVQDAGVGILDLLELLAHWGACP